LKLMQGILISLFVVLVLFGPGLIIYSYLNPSFNMSSILSAASTYAVALLTVGYVLTTSRQLDVMSNQLEEAKRYRELQNQPLPWIRVIRLSVEKPRFYFSPTENHNEFDYIFLPRYDVSYSFKNIGASPSINTHISSNILIVDEDETANRMDETPRGINRSIKRLIAFFASSRMQSENGILALGAASDRIGALEPGELYPTDTSTCMTNIIPDDGEANFLKSMRNTSPTKLPQLSVEVLYKNIMGGCFISNYTFLVHPKNVEQYDVIAKWIASVISFPIKYKDEIIAIKNFDKTNPEKSDALFEELLKRSGIEDDDIELALRPLAYEVKAISIDQFNASLKELRHPMPLPPKISSYSLPCQDK